DVTMSPVTIRDAQDADMAAITAIYRHAVLTGTATFEIEPPDQAEMAARRDGMVKSGYPYLVAEAGGEIVGYAYSGIYRARPAYRSTTENSVYVREDRHGRGIGRALLAATIDKAAKAGFRQMIAIIGDSTNAGSIGLHAALGFVHVGVLLSVGWKHGRWLDTVLMQRPLGPGDTTARQTAGG